jgi:hypothetical protein
MGKLGTVVCCVGAIAAVGCKKKDSASAGGSADPAGSAATPGSATAATPSGGKADCSTGAYFDPGGAYCVVVPEGFKDEDGPEKQDNGSLIVFNDEDGYTFSIEVVNKSNFDNYKGAMVMKPDEKDGRTLHVNETIGADGVYQRKQNGDGMYQFATVKRGEGYVACEAAYSAAKPTKPEDACKTLRAL